MHEKSVKGRSMLRRGYRLH